MIELKTNLPYFYSHFPEFSPKFSSILLKFAKIVNNSTIDFIFKDKKYCSFFGLNFLAKILAKYFKIQPISSKIVQNKLL